MIFWQVLIEEQEIITDADRDAEKSIQPVGPSFINSNPGEISCKKFLRA
jgi:hypothetical protein